MMKVYAVERGAYSDYEVVALFRTQEAAKTAARELGGEVVEREVYDTLPERVPYYVIEQGNHQATPTHRTIFVWPWEGPYFTGRMVRGAAYHVGPYIERAWGTDEEAVRRRWQEKHQQREIESIT